MTTDSKETRISPEDVPFSDELTSLINRHSKESESHTPDFILSQYIENCLRAFVTATQQRETWHGRDARPAHVHYGRMLNEEMGGDLKDLATKPIKIEGKVTAYFEDTTLYDKYMESEEETKERLVDVFKQLSKIHTIQEKSKQEKLPTKLHIRNW